MFDLVYFSTQLKNVVFKLLFLDQMINIYQYVSLFFHLHFPSKFHLCLRPSCFLIVKRKIGCSKLLPRLGSQPQPICAINQSLVCYLRVLPKAFYVFLLFSELTQIFLRAVLIVVTYNILSECQEHIEKPDQEISVHSGINKSTTKAPMQDLQPKESHGT